MTAATATSRLLAPRDAYALWASQYDDELNPIVALEERVMSELLPPVRGLRVVDLACGTGRWMRRLAALGAIPVGVDFSEPMLHRAPAGAVAGAASQLPLRDGVADLVLCSLALGYFPDLAAVAQELRRIVRPDASVWVSDLHPEAVAAGWTRSFRVAGRTVEIASQAYTDREICAAFAAAGLRMAAQHSFHFGEPERAIFARAGREDRFTAASAGPAIAVWQFACGHPVRRSRSQRNLTCITGARVATSATQGTPNTLYIAEGRIVSSSSRLPEATDLTGHLVLPGLVNAHDHLEFNLFPRLGHGPYANSAAWAADIHNVDRSLILAHSSVPKSTRLWWGALKNLLSGVTTVCHHNPYDEAVFTDDFPVRVLRDFAWAHSFAFDDVEQRHRAAPPCIPFILHLGEGSDAASAGELNRLCAAGALDGRTVVVHGAALSGAALAQINAAGAALVWCPSSNLFTLGRTLDPAHLPSRAALGSDSALTGCGDLLDELRCARVLGASPERLYAMVTAAAADVLRLGAAEGTLSPGAPADFIVLRDDGRPPCEQLVDADFRRVELVVRGGRVLLCSPGLLSRVPADNLQALRVDGVLRFVAAPVADLFASAAAHLGSQFRLAGRSIEC